jgi:alpha-tubulin suppressor-like RCC1 family protein
MNSAYAVPVTAAGAAPLDRVVQASMSPYFACAVVMKDTGREVWCWGSNYHGNVAPSDKMPRQYPTHVAGLTDPSLVRVIGYDDAGNLGGTACAIDGAQVRCWGSNATGVAGVGNATSPILSPTPVVLQNAASTLSGADGLESAPGGGGTFCAHTSANALWCWGNGFANYAANYGVSNVVSQGNFLRPSNSVAHPRFLTADGLYHAGPTAIVPNCSAL